jgi:mono/diheme cytochrome c family protein
MTNTRRIITGLVIVALLAGFAAVAVILGGYYDVSATRGHSRPVEWVLRTTMENSVRRNARQVRVPADLDLTDRAYAAQFIGHYDAACATCHAAPGRDRDPWMVIYPEPAPLTDHEVVRRWSDEELFWLLKHGIKDTGMMALGPTHTDDDIWGVTAFVRQLPDMTAEQYRALVAYQQQLQEANEHGQHGGE